MSAVRDHISDIDDEALFADGFDDAVLGWYSDWSEGAIVVYDIDKCVDILSKDMSHSDAQEYFEFNVLGSHVGPRTPVFLNRLPDFND